jgi:hypothetical protein
METERLFENHIKVTLVYKDFGRTEAECALHLSDVMAIAFEISGKSLSCGIKDVTAGFHKAHSRKIDKITPRRTELILNRYFIEKKWFRNWDAAPANEDECKLHIEKVLAWMIKEKGYRLVYKCISLFYENKKTV